MPKEIIMDRKVIKKIILTLLETWGITAIVLLSVFPVSCKVTTQGIQLIGGNYKVPKLLNINVNDEKSVSLDFSDEVKVENLIVSPFVPGFSDSVDISNSMELSTALDYASGNFGMVECNVEYSNENKTTILNFENGTEAGKAYEIYGVVRDRTGNTLTFCIPFTGYNSRIPKIQITEVHPAMAAVQKTEDQNGTRRLEYVECCVLSDGNLAGLELCSGYAGDSKGYEFLPLEVQKGEVFVVHLRTWGEGCISEEGNDLDLAFSRYCGEWRDLWSSNTTKPMGEKNDVIVIRNKTTGVVLDCFWYEDGTISNWGEYLKTDFTVTEGFAEIYPDGINGGGCSSAGIGTTKVFARGGDGRWSITTPSPGSL